MRDAMKMRFGQRNARSKDLHHKFELGSPRAGCAKHDDDDDDGDDDDDYYRDGYDYYYYYYYY